MRKMTICLLLILCSVFAFGQQPQWKVVASVVLFNQNQPISQTTLLTPTEPGMYRLSAYFSGVGSVVNTQGGVMDAIAYDKTGGGINVGGGISCAGPMFVSSPATPISLKPNVPVTYAVRLLGGPCQYNLAITVEQLVQ